jgi:hypothetical protein
MLLVVILALCAGVLLGQRFKILPLLIASCLGPLVAGIAEAMRGGTSWDICLAVLAAVICLQLGYLLGLALRHLPAASTASRLRGASLNNSLPPGTLPS